MQHDLGVAIGVEMMSEASEFLAQLAEVIGLAAVDDGHVSRRRPHFHRLFTEWEIDDRQGPVAKPDVSIDVGARIVRTSILHGRGHVLDDLALGRDVTVETDLSGDSAHCASSLPAALWSQRHNRI